MSNVSDNCRQYHMCSFKDIEKKAIICVKYYGRIIGICFRKFYEK